MTATDEIKVRIAPEQKATIARAAEVRGVNLSQFVRDAAQQRAETVLAQIEFAAYTVVPAASFDALVEALDTPDRPNQLLVAAAQRLREFDLD